MAFLIHSTDDGRACPWEYLPAAAITPKIGMALHFYSGKLTTTSGTTKPTYISMVDKSAALTAGDIIPVIKIQPDIVFETTISGTAATLTPGTAVQVASGGMGADFATTSGTFTLETGAAAVGDTVRGRFL